MHICDLGLSVHVYNTLNTDKIMGLAALAAITGTTILVLHLNVKSLQLN